MNAPANGEAPPSGPFVGLDYFTQDDAALFFGRDTERSVLISNLRASRLTVLYAQSGAGKSSVLRAGVSSRLIDLAKRSYSQKGNARYIPVVFNSWRDDPAAELITQVNRVAEPFLPEALPELGGRRLDEAIDAISHAAGANILVMLDQFEEYFLYRARESADASFASQFAACINRPDLRANFLIAIREDAYSVLGDIFNGRIDNVYSNYLHLEPLTRASAREAIEKPVASFNRLNPGLQPMSIAPDLVEIVLDDLRPDGFQSDQEGTGALRESELVRQDEVSAPYLQLVMQRLWQTEVAAKSHTLRTSTLADLGGAQRIVRTHVDRALSGLPDEEREAAVDIFRHLVTPSGTKIALSAADLAEYSETSSQQAGALLERLTAGDARILRPVPASPGEDIGPRYEISHDLLAPAVLDWSRRQRASRLEHQRDHAEQRAATERRRARLFRGLASAAACLLVVAVVLVAVAVRASHSSDQARNEADSRAIAARAESMLGESPERATMLALQGLHISQTSQAQAALRAALPQMQVVATLSTPAPVRTAAFSANGKYVLTAAADGTIRLWDGATYQWLAKLPSFGALDGAAISADGALVAIASTDGEVHIINVATAKVVQVLRVRGAYAVSSVTFSPDGRSVAATYSDGVARIWSVRTGRNVVTLSGQYGHVLTSIAFSGNSRQVVTASASGDAQIWVARTGQAVATLPGHLGLFNAEFSPDDRLVVTAGGSGIAQVWNVAARRIVTTLRPWAASATSGGIPPYVLDASFSPNGRQIVTASGNGVVKVWDVASHKAHVLSGPSDDSVVEAGFSPDGTSVVTAGGAGLATVWNLTTGRPTAVLQAGGTDQLRSAAFSPNGELAATGSRSGVVTIWKRPAARAPASAWKRVSVVVEPEFDAVDSLAFSNNSKLLASGEESGRVYLSTVPNGDEDGEINDAEGDGPMTSVNFDPRDRDLLLTADSDGFARIFNLNTSPVQQVQKFGFQGYAMNAASYAPNGNQIVTAGTNGYAQLWSSEGQPVGKQFGYGYEMTSAAFDADGQQIVTTDTGGYTAVWNARTGAQVSFSGENGGSIPSDAAFTADSDLVVVGGSDGTAYEWDVATDEPVLTFAGHSGPIAALARYRAELITASSDGTAKIWDLNPIEQRAILADANSAEVYTADFDPANAKLVVTADSNGLVHLWNTSDGQSVVMQAPGGTALSSAEFFEKGQQIVTAGAETAAIWSIDKIPGPPERVISTKMCSNSQSVNAPGLYSATFSRNGRSIVTADADGAACVWNVSSGKRLAEFIEPAGVSGGESGGLGVGGAAIRWAVFSPDDESVLTASDDGTARIWDVVTGRQLLVVDEPGGDSINDAWFSPDGRTFVTASDDGTARIWDAATGRLLHVLSSQNRQPVYNAAFSPNGKLVVTCSASSAEVWSVSGQLLTQYDYGSEFSDCEFNRNGTEVVTAGADGKTRIFTTELAGSLKTIMRIAGRRANA